MPVARSGEVWVAAGWLRAHASASHAPDAGSCECYAGCIAFAWRVPGWWFFLQHRKVAVFESEGRLVVDAVALPCLAHACGLLGLLQLQCLSMLCAGDWVSACVCELLVLCADRMLTAWACAVCSGRALHTTCRRLADTHTPSTAPVVCCVADYIWHNLYYVKSNDAASFFAAVQGLCRTRV
jgi:hypothetical protein